MVAAFRAVQAVTSVAVVIEGEVVRRSVEARDVVSFAAVDQIVARAGDDDVRALQPRDPVVAGTADDEIVMHGADKVVVAQIADNQQARLAFGFLVSAVLAAPGRGRKIAGRHRAV